MTTFRIACRGGEVIASERDSFAQLNGERIPAAQLTTAHTIPGRGRVLAIIPIAEGIDCSLCQARLPDMMALLAHGRHEHKRDATGAPLLKLVEV